MIEAAVKNENYIEIRLLGCVAMNESQFDEHKHATL